MQIAESVRQTSTVNRQYFDQQEEDTQWEYYKAAFQDRPGTKKREAELEKKPAEMTLQIPTKNQAGRRRKYISLCLKDEVLLQAMAKEVTYLGLKLEEGVLDSWAEESVSPPRYFPEPVTPSPMSKAQGSYRVADGHRVPNIG